MDITKLTRRNLPSFWRKDSIIALADVLMSCLSVTNDSYTNLIEDTEEQIQYSAQRLSLEQSLNNRFPTANGQIRVQNNDSSASIYTFSSDETIALSEEIYLEGTETIYTFNKIDKQAGTQGFTVFTPPRQSEALIKQWVERVNILSIPFEITTITE